MAVDVRIISHKDEIIQRMNRAKAIALEIVGQNAERIASDKAPVDTGRLRASISHVVDDDSVTIGTNVEYAIYQELGTLRMSAANDGRGYLRIAITDYLEQYMKLFADALSDFF